MGIGSPTQFNLGMVDLGGIRQKFGNLCPLAQADRQDPGSLGVEGAGMSDTPLAGQSPYRSYGAKGGHALGLIDV
jgi:hypothetical protein